jgi:hypothetical protein
VWNIWCWQVVVRVDHVMVVVVVVQVAIEKLLKI